MAKFSCFSLIGRRKKKVKGDDESTRSGEVDKAIRTLQVRLQQQPLKPLEIDGKSKPATFGVLIPYGVEKKYSSPPSGDTRSPKSPIRCVEAAACEGEYEHKESPLAKGSSSNHHSDLQPNEANSGDVTPSRKLDLSEPDSSSRGVQSGHFSDPGVGKAEFWASPKLTRSCSNLETHKKVVKKMTSKMPASKSLSLKERQEMADSVRKDVDPGSPSSVSSHYSADRVMLKKHSSSQVLPSRSRKLWWKLFLWSHRNLHRTRDAKPNTLSPISANKQGGYSSDTLEPNLAMQFGKTESPLSYTGELLDKGKNIVDENKSWDGFHIGASALWPQNQWVAFSTEASSSSRVQDWVKDLRIQTSVEKNEDDNEGIVSPRTPKSPVTPATARSKSATYFSRGLEEDTLHANTVIQSLNSCSTVAHISGMGMKAIPNISCFCSLRSVNLSNNFIAHITPGSLPKSLHTLNLSKNKLSAIEGLRDLTRLRVLDLSYNRISRIGRGLSSCNVLKELYLSGNKISDVEGLHRLLKLTVLDLSFNKITTTRALGQLVANYNSLQALNLLGNTIQTNIGDEQLRKTVCSLLPKLVYLNKQSIKPQRAREVLTDSVAKAALGNKGWNPRRKASKKLSQRSASFKKTHALPSKKSSSFPTHGHKRGASVV
ncbi:hypothetical protein D8674_012935 [Pyrus ussuriensis x Pyrus communis]|uniref:Uncharacterized protein n=1 Tax=Pyrus ussuriensis x Pyrus communis TaxID=2448454 RepID=A0A5N5GN94_9ROSA|nr:hypothetical protein D8674_012935 [Pyrus ussuriensis x Pyrus communis]